MSEKKAQSPKSSGVYGVRGFLYLPYPEYADGNRICRWCHGSLPKGRRSWCSNECVAEYDLRGGNWGRVRAEILKRDDHKCVSCGESAGKRLEVDHILPVCEGGDDRPDNLRTLCSECHRTVTAELRIRIKERS